MLALNLTTNINGLLSIIETQELIKNIVNK
jgi:hypothetical protein